MVKHELLILYAKQLFKECSEGLFNVYQSIEYDEALQGEKEVIGDVFEKLTELENIMMKVSSE